MGNLAILIFDFNTNYGKDPYQFSNRQFAKAGNDHRHRTGNYQQSCGLHSPGK